MLFEELSLVDWLSSLSIYLQYLCLTLMLFSSLQISYLSFIYFSLRNFINIICTYLGARRSLPSPKLVSDSEKLVVFLTAIISAEWHRRFLRLPLSNGAAPFEAADCPSAATAAVASLLSVDDDDVVMAPSETFTADLSWIFRFENQLSGSPSSIQIRTMV